MSNSVSEFFSVDTDSCLRDGICAAECPARIIYMHPDDNVPRLFAGAQSVCIGCDHCVAVCPAGAVRLAGHDFALNTGLDPVLRISAEAADQFLASRRSIRSFSKAPVAKDDIEKLLNTARYAPTASNRQPVRWVVVHEPEKSRAIAGHVIDWMRHLLDAAPDIATGFKAEILIKAWEKGHDPILRGAPHLVMAVTKEGPFGASDAAVALTYLELAAHGHGIGACWGGYVTAAASSAASGWAPLRAALGLADDEVAQGGQMLGYARYSYPRLPWRKKAEIDWR